jgi:hypothetical protein
MTEKIRFSEYVRQQVVEGKFYGVTPYRWHTDGWLGSEEFTIYFSKKKFWSKKVVKLTRRKTDYRSTYIKLSEDEQNMLWDIQDIAVKLYEQAQKKRDEEDKKNREALEWWP